VTGSLARTVRLAGGSRSALAAVATRTIKRDREVYEGHRLKRSNYRVLISARYCNGFPIIRCNIERLVPSIDSIRSRLFRYFPAGF
jgi:hypothetical protein